MKTATKTLAALSALALFAGSTNAASISYIGFQDNVESASNDPTAGWRNASPAKPLDIDGDNILGTDGFYLPGAVGGNDDIQLPGYIANIAQDTSGGNNYNSSWGVLDDPSDPDGSDTWTTGGWRNTAPNFELATITLTGDAATLLAGKTLRIAWFYDIYNFGGSQIMTVTANSGGSASSPALAFTSAIDGTNVAFFDVSNVSNGDVIHLLGTGPEGTNSTMGGLAFDVLVPEPGSLALMSLGGLLMLRRSSAQVARRRRG